LETDDCDIKADCTDILGGYECNCIDGWKGNGTFCENLDECTGKSDIEKSVSNDSETPPCDAIGGLCTDTIGSFTCVCDAGFSGDGLNCTNVDECISSPCDANASCQDQVGSFTCSCNDGWNGDGMICLDVDECSVTGSVRLEHFILVHSFRC
jgi:hypothetical protein